MTTMPASTATGSIEDSIPATRITVGGVPPADLLPVGRKATPGYRIARRVIGPIVRFLFNIRVHGLERVPAGPYVLIANHLNWVDSFAILLSLPDEPRIHFLGDPRELVNRPFQWWVVRHVGGYVCVDRSRHGDLQLFEHVQRCLEKGGVVALYPEGCYGDREGDLVALHKGFAHFALRAHVPVLPVALSGCKELWWRKRIDVVVGDVIDPEGMGVDELLERGESGLRAVLPERPRRFLGPRLFRRRLTNLL